jgi:hypothetical protein
MDNSSLTRISITPTVPRQTPKNEFGHVLSNTISGVVSAGGALLGSAMPGMPIVSSAVSAVSSLANSPAVARSGSAATGTVNLYGAGGQAGGGISSVNGVGSTVGTGSIARGTVGLSTEPAGVNDMLSGMRAEADRSMMMQMQMQTESREYNTLTNILKLRHDSAKAAINNIR